MSSSKNNIFHFFFLIINIICVYGAVDEQLSTVEKRPWNYITTGGVFEWCQQFKTCCGDHQSPINFDTKSVEAESFDPITFKGYDTKLKSIVMKNNGHDIYIDVGYPGALPVMSDGGLNAKYTLDSFHFHWGSDNEQGAEHTVNGVYYPLEMHIVHINSKYGSIDKALKNTDGLAVLGILYGVAKEDNPVLEKIVKEFSSVMYNGDSKTISKPNFSIQDLFPDSTEYFFRYSGSLTTPPCNEVVTWTVFEVPQTISLKQLKAFRDLKGSKKDDNVTLSLGNNYRPIQKLKDRKILKRRSSDDSNSVSAQFPLLFTAAASAFGLRFM
uniref:carbonic anhydrase n=1 Tax=Strigamia maritima TaxID=126957 RepID=T1J6C9_STRMM